MMLTVRRIGTDERAVTVVEFALVAPVMLMMIMGMGDMLYQAYAQSILAGAVQKAGRDSSIQGGAQKTTTIDNTVIGLIGAVVKNPANNCGATNGSAATWCSTRSNYDNFSAAAPEPFVDTNGNGVRDPGECFTDVNGNGTWDADPGITGQGGANDVTLYRMSVTYPRLFPVAGLLGMPNTQTISAQTFLKNQPYATQTTTTPKTVCT